MKEDKEYRDYDEHEGNGKALDIALSVTMFIVLVLVVGLAIIMAGCTTTKYVPVETVRTEYLEADTTGIYNRLLKLFESSRERETRSDSLVDRFKETVVLKENGDTARHDRERVVYVASIREKELEHKIEQKDSVISALRLQLSSIKSDTIREPYPIEKELTKWQQTKMDLGGIAIGAVIVVLCAAVLWLIKKFRK